jgi:2-oxoglutarate dehydrogenase E2 component (dihydrolipoamide succinyltransferase)
MIVEIKVPSPGESISEVEIASWLVEDGDYVEKDQEIAEVESDKATLPLIAEQAGTIKILAAAGETVKVGAVVCKVDTEGRAPKGKKAGAGESKAATGVKTTPLAGKITPASGTKNEQLTGDAAKNVARLSTGEPGTAPEKAPPGLTEEYGKVKISPVAAKMMEENGLSVEDLIMGLKRITRKEVQAVLDAGAGIPVQQAPSTASRAENRQRMSNLRRKLAGRLVAVKNET